MSQLIQMRQRIKAVTTIKKITSAMRLISRSLHTRLVKQKTALSLYRSTVCTILDSIQSTQTAWRPERFFPLTEHQPKELLIIMGSQKGMCGTYNAGLLYWIEHHYDYLSSPHINIISMGKKVTDHLIRTGIKPFAVINDVRMSDLDIITQKVIDHILPKNTLYTKVRIISNVSKTFFTHELNEVQIIPFAGCSTGEKKELSDYQWSHQPEDLLEILIQDYLSIAVRSALFESLVGEQAARFIAMDNATRNAKNFLSTMNLQYNKLRQAKITKELTELAGAFESQSLV